MLPSQPVHTTFSTPLRRPPTYRTDLLAGKNVDDFLEESNGLRKELSIQRERIEELTLKCKKLEREKHRQVCPVIYCLSSQNVEYQKILETIADSTSKDKDAKFACIVTKLKRRLDLLEEQLEEKEKRVRSLQDEVKRSQKRETRVALENAYGEIDRLRRLLSSSVSLPQGAGTDGCQQPRRNRCSEQDGRGSSMHNDRFQNARLVAMTKAIRALHREKEAVGRLNNQLIRQLQKCKHCCPQIERTGRRRPSDSSLPAGTIFATPLNPPKTDNDAGRGNDHAEVHKPHDAPPTEKYIDAIEVDEVQVRLGDLERRNQYLEKRKQELEANYADMV
ncbi:hypothetical protein AAHC03_013971 [Spirometra sp. Aus1]